MHVNKDGVLLDDLYLGHVAPVQPHALYMKVGVMAGLTGKTRMEVSRGVL